LIIFVLQTKRKDMLQSISWLQFGSFLLVAGGGYYLYVLVRYYRKEITSFFLGSGRKPKELSKPARPGASQGIGEWNGSEQSGPFDRQVAPSGAVDKEESIQPGLFNEQGGPSDQMGESFKVMEKAIGSLTGVIKKGVAEKISRKELLNQLSEVLAKYGQLKDTRFQDAINNFLTRSCSTNFSLLLGEDELDVLWN